MDIHEALASIPRQLEAARAVAATGVLQPVRPDRLLGAGRAFLRWGPTPGAAYAAAAALHPALVAVADDDGTITFAELHRRSNAITNGLRAGGLRPGQAVGILCRNTRAFPLALAAASKAGADAILLNTGFAGPQLAEVLERESVSVVVFDEEFADVVAAAAGDRRLVLGWHEGTSDVQSLDDLARQAPDGNPPPPGRQGRVTLLTSGTTGTPKGARRGTPSRLDTGAALLTRLPLRARTTVVVAAPLFHAWGLAHLTIAMGMASTVVLRRTFDPEGTLAAVDTSDADTLAVVPVMLQRILALPDEVRRRYDTTSLRIVASSGSALPGELATRWMDAFGDNLYNLYGSTEVAIASLATPDDLRAAPGTAGRPPAGTTVRIVDAQGRPVAAGQSGRIFVGNGMAFEGYTGGGTKQVIDDLMSIGDVGRFDAEGRLFVEGRDDDMIVSGGENVFPSEVEDLLADHPDIAEAAVIGVSDDEFGQRLAAFVVQRRGARLTVAQVQAHVRERLARFKVPRDVTFVAALPRNDTGKVLKRALRQGPTAAG